MTAIRSLFARTYMKAALMISPMVFIGAECAVDGPGFTPLAMDAMRADITQEGNFLCDDVTVTDQGTFWRVIAQGGGATDTRRIELDVPKEATVPYTINVANDNQAVIYYCVPLTATSCKNFYADQAHGGSGTITITNIAGHLEGPLRGTVQIANGTETRSISNGEFKVDL